MCMFGDSLFLLYRFIEKLNFVLKSFSLLRRLINGIIGFFFMDFFQIGKDIVFVYEKEVLVLDEIVVMLDQSSIEGGYWGVQEFQDFDNFIVLVDVIRLI